MAYCITTMIITANNEENYKTVLEWCDLFNADDKIQTFAPQCSNENFSVQYDELNINQSEAQSVFKTFAQYCLANNVTGGMEVYFDVSFGNGGEEYKLLYKLENGEATEMVSYFDDSEAYGDDELTMDPQPDDACGENEAEGSTEGFIIEDGVLKKYEGTDSEVIVPVECNSIGQMAFCRSHIVKVILPNGLQEIDMYAFQYCHSLEEITLPETLQKIGSRAFAGCSSLKNIKFPGKLKIIEGYAFEGCTSLSEIKIPSGLQEIGEGTFSGCSSLKKIVFSEDTKNIVKREFEGCKSLQEIKLPKNLQIIGDCAFMDCISATKLVIPKDVQRIGMQAFYNCRSLREIENYSTESLLYGYILRMPSDDTFPPKATDEILPSVVSGFMPNENFEELKPAEKRIALNCYLSSSGQYPENKREAYESYIRKQSGRLLADYTQQGEIDLLKKLLKYDYIKLPSLQKAIEAAGENKDVRVMLTDYLNAHFSREVVEKNAQKSQDPVPKKLSESEQLKKIWSYKKLDDGTLCITSYKGTDTDIIVPAVIGKYSVSEIGEKAFCSKQGHCKNESIRSEITNVVLPEGIVKIGESAFENCPQLTSIRLPDSLRTIEQCAFWGCAKLEHVILPEGLIKIGNSAFECCWGLNGLTIPSTVETVGYSIIAFNKIISDVYILSESVQFLTDAFFDDKHALAYASPQLTIHGIKGSTAEEYATTYGFKFEKLE